MVADIYCPAKACLLAHFFTIIIEVERYNSRVGCDTDCFFSAFSATGDCACNMCCMVAEFYIFMIVVLKCNLSFSKIQMIGQDQTAVPNCNKNILPS